MIHPLTRAMFSLLPLKPSIRFIFDKKPKDREVFDLDSADTIDEKRKVKKLYNKIRKISGFKVDSAMIYLRENEVFIVFYTDLGNKYYIEFHEGLNNPLVEEK